MIAGLSAFAGTAAASTSAGAATAVACPRPTATQAGCSAIRQLHPAEPAGARPNTVPAGYSPADLRSAYNLPATGGSGQTVAVINAYDDPNAESDLGNYRTQYGLGPCSTANGCFKKVNQLGAVGPLPAANATWSADAAASLETISAVCPSCKLILVEATDATIANLGTAVNKAATVAKFISTTFAFAENGSDVSYDNSYFHHPGVVITAITGDAGYGAMYPGTSRYATAVGGTTLLRSTNARGWSETAWTSGGSGCSAYLSQPVFQDTYTNGCANRATADVSADADPSTGVAVYQTYGASGWIVEGGTGIAASIIVGVYALAGTPGSADTPNYYPYVGGGSGGLNDITSGSNGSCSSSPVLCHAGTRWDGPTGLGTPNGVTAFKTSHAVFVKNPGPQTTNYGTSVFLQLSAWDSQSGTTLSYSAGNLPPGLSISSSGGAITGTPTCTTTTRSYTVFVSVSDGVAGASVSIPWTINSHPTCP